VRPTSAFVVAITIASLSWACGSVSALPAGPSSLSQPPVLLSAPTVLAQSFPSLTGRWRASGTTVFRNLETGNSLDWGGCSGSFTITEQDGHRFSGPLGTQGGGWNSDRFCTASGTFTGELVEPDGTSARARLEGNFQNWPRPAVSPSCELISAGDGIWTGSATSDAIRLQVRDTLRCAASVDGALGGTAMANFERTVSLVFQR
jgi:hypothetical protein